MKEIKLGADGLKKGSRGHGGKGAVQRDLMEQVHWSKYCAEVQKSTLVSNRQATVRDCTVASSAVRVTPGSHVQFEPEPGVLVEGTVTSKLGGDFVIEVEGGVTIPGVHQHELNVIPARAHDDSFTPESFVFVNAPLHRADSVGAPLPRLESGSPCSPNAQVRGRTTNGGNPSTASKRPVAMTWASQANSMDTPRPPTSFRDLQAQDEASGCLQASGADVSLPALSTQDRPNPRVVSGLQEMGFEAQLCGAAALSTGNESLEKAARWLADALEQHAHARSAGGKRQPHRHEESDTNGLGASAQAMPASPRAIGFVDKLAAAIASSQASASATNENEAMVEDGWEVVSKVAQE